jgi:hypothetical protein
VTQAQPGGQDRRVPLKSSRSALSSPSAKRVISSSSSIASLLHLATERFAIGAKNFGLA